MLDALRQLLHNRFCVFYSLWKPWHKRVLRPFIEIQVVTWLKGFSREIRVRTHTKEITQKHDHAHNQTHKHALLSTSCLTCFLTLSFTLLTHIILLKSGQPPLYFLLFHFFFCLSLQGTVTLKTEPSECFVSLLVPQIHQSITTVILYFSYSQQIPCKQTADPWPSWCWRLTTPVRRYYTESGRNHWQQPLGRGLETNGGHAGGSRG